FIELVIMNQENSFTFQPNSAEDNSDSISIIPFESSSLYNLECSNSYSENSTSSLYATKYPTSLSNYEQFTLPSDKPENLTSPLDSFNDSDSLNLNPIQNTKKHKSVFITSSNKKPKPEKNGKIEKCEETFALLTSISTLGAYLRTVHHLSENSKLLPLSGASELLVFKKPIHIAQKDPTQLTLLDTIKKQLLLFSKKKDRLTSRLLA
ncbi:8834_t:CDS:2, partial [Scutellospora calospora]